MAAIRMPRVGTVRGTRKPRVAKTPRNVAIKTRDMIGEGYRPDVAQAAAYSMNRRRKLGPAGGYTRVTNRPRGPRGAQRRVI